MSNTKHVDTRNGDPNLVGTGEVLSTTPSPPVHLNANEEKVLEFLADQVSYDGGGYWGFAGIAQHTKLDRRVIRRACRSLARKGFTDYQKGLWNDDGRPAGAGYGITKSGLEIRQVLISKDSHSRNRS